MSAIAMSLATCRQSFSLLTVLRRIGALAALVVISAAPAPLRAEDTADVARLEIAEDTAGLPVPRGATDVTRISGPVLRELKATVAADGLATLAFYRHALGLRGWKEDADGAVDSAAETRRGFTGAEGAAVLVLTHAGGSTAVSLVIRTSEEVVAARQLEEREAERAVRGEAVADPDEPLHARSDAAAPIPVPARAEGVVVDAANGTMTFTSPATVRQLERFYRAALRPMGFVERPAPPHPGVAALEFVKAEVPLLVTFARNGASVTVTATGNAVKTGIHLNDEAVKK